MCVWCEGGAPGLDGFSVEARADARLAGVLWSGAHADADSGGLAAALTGLRARVLEDQAFAPGAIVALTLAGDGDRVECFVGARLAGGAQAPEGLTERAVPAGDYGFVNHHRSEGDAIDRYGSLLAWLGREGIARDRSLFRHREEYPLHADFARPETVRLMVPVQRHARIAGDG